MNVATASPRSGPRRRARAGTLRVLAVPCLLLIASIAGLIIGLTGDGLPDAVSWALLCLPIVLAAIALTRRG